MGLKRISGRGWLGEEGEAEGVCGLLGVSECEEGGRGLSKELLPVLESRSHHTTTNSTHQGPLTSQYLRLARKSLFLEGEHILRIRGHVEL